MPTGGQISAATGLRLQNATPGIEDIGNANISGTMLAKVFSNGGKRGIGVECFGTAQNVLGTPRYSVYLGANAYNGYAGFSDNSVVIGYHAGGLGGSVMAIGAESRAGSPAFVGGGDIAIGFSSRASRGLVGACMAIGNLVDLTNCVATMVIVPGNAGATLSNLTNCIGLGNGCGARLTADGTISIGDNQRRVFIGAYDLSTGFATSQFKQIANVTVASTAVETTLVGAGAGSATIPANVLNVGSTVRITARGIIADTGTPTVQFRVKIGANTFLDFGAVALPALGGTHGWKLEGDITIRTLGAGGTALGNGIVTLSVTGAPDMDTVNTATTALNTTIANLIDATVQWGTSDPANTITCTNLSIEVIG